MTFEVGKVPKMANFDQKMAAKLPKSIQSKIWKKRLEILGHSTFWQIFGKIHQRSSEIQLLTDDKDDEDDDEDDAGRQATT